MFVRFKKRLVIGWIISSGLVLLPLLGLAEDAQTVFQKGQSWLQLAPIEPGTKPNSEASELTEAQVRRALGSVSVRLDASRSRGLFSRRKQDPIPFFSETALEQLAGPVTEAINGAGANRDLLLQVSQNRRQDAGLSGFLKDSRVSTARLFYRNEQLHLVVGAVERDPKASDSRKLSDNPKASGYGQFANQAKMPMGSRAKEAKLAAELNSDLALDSSPQGRADWLVLDLNGLVNETSSETLQSQQTAPAPTTSQAKPTPRPEPQALETMDAQTLSQLRELRELKRRDLITDELYEAMVRELLDRDKND